MCMSKPIHFVAPCLALALGLVLPGMVLGDCASRIHQLRNEIGDLIRRIEDDRNAVAFLQVQVDRLAEKLDKAQAELAPVSEKLNVLAVEVTKDRQVLDQIDKRRAGAARELTVVRARLYRQIDDSPHLQAAKDQIDIARTQRDLARAGALSKLVEKPDYKAALSGMLAARAALATLKGQEEVSTAALANASMDVLRYDAVVNRYEKAAMDGDEDYQATAVQLDRAVAILQSTREQLMAAVQQKPDYQVVAQKLNQADQEFEQFKTTLEPKLAVGRSLEQQVAQLSANVNAIQGDLNANQDILDRTTRNLYRLQRAKISRESELLALMRGGC